jgi:hypothetical protein
MIAGTKEPDLTKIQEGSSRAQVEKMLGKPLWQPGVADGLNFEVYQYRAAQPANPAGGAGLLAVDTPSLGIGEYNMRDTVASAPGKQIAIGYDDHDQARFRSAPWSVQGPPPCRRMRSLLPPHSGVPATARPPALSTGTNGPGESATLVPGRVELQVDGRVVADRSVELSPGHHKLSYRSGNDNSGTFDIEVLSGRLYRLESHRYYASVDFYYIEDVASHETLQCMGFLGNKPWGIAEEPRSTDVESPAESKH